MLEPTTQLCNDLAKFTKKDNYTPFSFGRG